MTASDLVDRRTISKPAISCQITNTRDLKAEAAAGLRIQSKPSHDAREREERAEKARGKRNHGRGAQRQRHTDDTGIQQPCNRPFVGSFGLPPGRFATMLPDALARSNRCEAPRWCDDRWTQDALAASRALSKPQQSACHESPFGSRRRECVVFQLVCGRCRASSPSRSSRRACSAFSTAIPLTCRRDSCTQRASEVTPGAAR